MEAFTNTYLAGTVTREELVAFQSEHLTLRARADGLESSAADSTALFARQESQLETLRTRHAEAQSQANAREAETQFLRADLNDLHVSSAAR